MENHRLVVGCLDARDVLIARSSCFRADDCSIGHRVNAPLHISGPKRAAIVKANPLSQVKDICQRIASLPTFSDPWLQIEVLVFAHERIEQQFVDALRLGIGTNAWIKIRRTGLNEKSNCVGIGTTAGAANQEQ